MLRGWLQWLAISRVCYLRNTYIAKIVLRAYGSLMNLSALERNRVAVISKVGDQKQEDRLRSVGIRLGAGIQVIGRTSSRGYLVKVDDTRLVLSRELAQTIDCTYR